MDKSSLKELYGIEYPEAVTMFGIRMPVVRESRFLRLYENKEEKFGTEVSKFEDGSAAITLDELKSEWANWTERDQQGFANACGHLHENPEFPDMLRFLMANGNQWQCSIVAGLVAHLLPQNEAFTVLSEKMAATSSHLANFIQAIALTKHSDASSLLRRCLDELWSQPGFWEDDPFLNWLASDAESCIQYLLDLGESRADFEDKVRSLNEHPCKGNRASCRRWLRPFYPWLPEPEPTRFGGMKL